MNIIPFGHRIVVKPFRLEDEDDVYKSAKALGIKLSDEHTKLEQTSIDKGIVIAIGPTAFKDFGGDPWCVVGDKVAFSRYGGKLIRDSKDPENEVLLLNDEDLICKIVDGE